MDRLFDIIAPTACNIDTEYRESMIFRASIRPSGQASPHQGHEEAVDMIGKGRPTASETPYQCRNSDLKSEKSADQESGLVLPPNLGNSAEKGLSPT